MCVCVRLCVFVLQLAVGVGVAWVLHGCWWDSCVLQHECRCEIVEGRFVCACVCVYFVCRFVCGYVFFAVGCGCNMDMSVGAAAVSCTTDVIVE